VGESFVDLTYRGLPLGRRIKLTQIRPSTGYLELPAPMPVGTRIAMATDDGVAIDAVVTQVHEQVGGSEQLPGMTIAPGFTEAAAAAWWKERVALPELAPPPALPQRPAPVPPRTQTVATSPPAHAEGAEEAPITAPMPVAEAAPEVPAPPDEAGGSLDQELLAQLGGAADPPLVDDGKKTVMMHSIDLSALGLEPGATGQFAASAAAAEVDEAGEGEGEGDADEAAAASANGEPRQPIVPEDRKKPSGKKRKKRR
jgi:hypothetical protein